MHAHDARQSAFFREAFTQRFSSTRHGARLARILAEFQLNAWGIPYGGEPSATAALIVAELASNAVTHGRVQGRDFELSMMLTANLLRIEVSDTRGEALPPAAAVPPAIDSETGRGLVLVTAFAARWGVTRRARSAPGKTVWAEVPV